MSVRRVLGAGIAVPIISLLVVTLAATVYALVLAFQVRGAPDQERIAQFAQSVGRSYWEPLAIALTVPAAAWAVSKMRRARELSGAGVGAIAGLLSAVVGFHVSIRALVVFALTIAAGWLGARMLWVLPGRAHAHDEDHRNR